MPHDTGWYVAWTPLPEGKGRRGEVVFCCRTEGVVRCNRPIGDPSAFLPIADERFASATWEGPFTLENLANVALARGGLGKSARAGRSSSKGLPPAPISA